MLCVRVTIWVPQRWSSPESAHHQQSINHSIVQRTEVQENVACGLVFEQSITRLGARGHLGISTATAPWTDSSGRSGSQTGHSQGWRGKSFCYCPFGIASVGPREGWTWRLSVVGLAAWKSEKNKTDNKKPQMQAGQGEFFLRSSQAHRCSESVFTRAIHCQHWRNRSLRGRPCS